MTTENPLKLARLYTLYLCVGFAFFSCLFVCFSNTMQYGVNQAKKDEIYPVF